MTPADIAHKLTLIANLTAGELQGWKAQLGVHRPAFDGEKAALTTRKLQLARGGR